MRYKNFILPLIVVAAAGFIWYSYQKDDQATTTPTNTNQQTNNKQPEQADSFNKKQYSLTDPTSPWVIVNKQNPLNPQTFVPSDLRLPNVSQRIPGIEQMKMRDQAATALEALFADAKAAGHSLQITTAFRGYNYQKTLYDGYVRDQGQAAADKESARPGYSEHQTGLAADIRPEDGRCYLEQCFGETPEGMWLAENAYKYGYIVRYAPGKESVTGYSYEPWHVRYVGPELSKELHRTGILTLEEFFDVPGGTTYRER